MFRRAEPRGSPFQMPTRLADGLGLESDLGHGCPRPCAPSPNALLPKTPGNLVPPRWLAGRQAGLGCTLTRDSSHTCGNSQRNTAQMALPEPNIIFRDANSGDGQG